MSSLHHGGLLGACISTVLLALLSLCCSLSIAFAQSSSTPPPARESLPTTAATQQSPPSPPNQAAPALGPITWPELDQLAADLALKIAARNLSSIAVFGAFASHTHCMLDLPIGEGFSSALAKRAQGFEVVERSALRDILTQQRVKETMLASDILATWLSSLAKVDGVVLVKLEDIEVSQVTVAVYVYDLRYQATSSFTNRKVVVTLDETQSAAIREPYHRGARVNVPRPGDALAAAFKVQEPICVHCPRPDYTNAARQAGTAGDVWLEILINEEGIPTDIEVVIPMGEGLDQSAVEAIQKWRFKPINGPEGKPIRVLATIDVQFRR